LIRIKCDQVHATDCSFGNFLAFAREGAQVWAATTEELPKPGPLRAPVRRVHDRPAVLAFAAEALAATGRIDILVNHAGGVLGQVGQPIEQVTPEQWQGIFDVNASGPFWFAQAVAPAMKAAGRGRIITISSGAGLGITLTGIQAYAAAKAASIALTRQLGHELGPFGITVNCIAPGFVRSNPASEKQWQSYGEAGQRALPRASPCAASARPTTSPRGLVLRLRRRGLGDGADVVGGWGTLITFFDVDNVGNVGNVRQVWSGGARSSPAPRRGACR
jgi:3-oxoacyl-[acyl-carrier protein] reductase